MKKVAFCLCILSMFIIAASAEADTVTFDCIADTWVGAYANTSNHGGADKLEVSDVYYTKDGSHAFDDFRRSYTAFQDITSQLSAGDIITNAYVTLYCEGFGTVSEFGGNIPQLDTDINNNRVNMHRVTANWGEGMTWNSGQPTYENTGSWTTNKNAGAPGSINFTCTNTVIQWFAYGGQEGFMFESDLDPNNLGQIYALFASREYSVIGHRPLLTVEYIPYEEPDPDPIPEPTTMILLGSLATGLFGFSGIKKRFNR